MTHIFSLGYFVRRSCVWLRTLLFSPNRASSRAIFHFSLKCLTFPSLPAVIKWVRHSRMSAVANRCCFHRPVNSSAVEVPVGVGAAGFSCDKTLSGFLVIEHVCLELCWCVWLCECDVVPRRRGHGKCEQHGGLAWADAVARLDVSVVEVESLRYQPHSTSLPRSILPSAPPPPPPTVPTW